MSNPITDARLALRDALTPLGYRVYPNPDANPVPPCIQIFANGDWLVNRKLRGAPDTRLSLRLSSAVASGNEEAFALLEQMVWDVMQLIPNTGVIGAPRLDISSSTECYVVDLVTLLSVEG